MTTTTLSALTGDSGVAIQLVAAIEGIPYLLTDGATAAAVTAWSGTDWTQALGGLEVNLEHGQHLSPWEPFKTSSSSAHLAVMDASGTNADTFGLLVFNREGGNSTRLTADVLPGDTTINVQSTSTFSGSGNIYVGNETIGYTATTASTFGTLTRGKWSPFAMEGGARFERTHRAVPLVPGIPADATTSSTVSDAPIEWKGRWVGIWAHRNLGGVLDVKAQAHLLFAGRIATVRDAADGRTVVALDDVRDVIGDAVILREQFSAKIKPTIFLDTGDQFSALNVRGSGAGSAKTANPLIVVPSGAAAPNQLNRGSYSAGELAIAINDWLASELNAGRLLFVMDFSPAVDSGSGVRSSVRYSDSSVTTDDRTTTIGTTSVRVSDFFGWNGDGNLTGQATSRTGTIYSAREPRQIALTGVTATLNLGEAQGSYVDQSTLLAPGLRLLPGSGSDATGIVRIGSTLFVCATPTIANGEGTITIGLIPLNQQVGENVDEGWSHPVSADGLIPIEQVLFLSAPFKSLMLTLLSSTGGGLNWALYDLLPEQCSASIPYDLMGTGLESELAAAARATDQMTVIVDKPTRLVDLVNVSMILRLLQLVWRQGRLALKGWPTPTSAATLAIVADDRATPINTEDDLLAVTEERDELLRNVIKIRYGASAFGEDYRNTDLIVDPGSANNYGARALTLDARNATRGTGIAGEEIADLLPTFTAGLTFLSRPALTVRVPVPHTLFETATAGEVCLLTDGHVRDPATGARGISARPALVVANRFSWGGPGQPASGEVDLMLFTRLSLAEYSPCAEVNAAAANAGYDAGTKVLTCSAHEHSAAGDPTHDAARFATGYKVRVIEIDPPTAAAPLTWTDTVASQTGDTITLTTGLAGWDNTKKYRVIADDYSTSITAQRTKTYQADDADGLIQNLRAPYGMTWSPTGQVTSYTDADPSTELPARPPTTAYGDGKPLDTGHARDLARGLNSIVSYHGPQQPQQDNSSSTASAAVVAGTYTWTLVHVQPVYLGVGVSTTDRTRKLYVAPTVSKAGAASANIRVTLSQRMPRTRDATAPDRDDVTRVAPYTEHTWSTTSATRVTETAVALDTSHLSSGHNHMPGIGWLYVEIGNHATFYGLGGLYVGPLEAP